MKRYTQFVSLVLLGLVALAGCDDNDWKPGEKYDTRNQVTVTSDDIDDIIVAAGEKGSVTVTFSRQSSEGEDSVALNVSDSEHFSASTLKFADGESTATAEITFKGSESLGVYSCEVSVPFGTYNNPYSEETNMCYIEAMVGEWELVHSNVYVYNDDLHNAYGFPDNIICDLEHFPGTTRYRLKNFAQDYDFTFDLDNNNYVVPRGGSWYGSNYWYFGDNTWNSESPLIFKEEPNYKLTYAYLYLGGYSALFPDQGWGYLYLGYGYWTSVDDVNLENGKSIEWSYLSIWWNTETD